MPGKFFSQEHMVVNGFAPECHHARFGDIRRWGPLVTVGGPASAYGPGVLAGEHTDAILRELGHTELEIAQLRTDRVVASEDAAVWTGL